MIQLSCSPIDNDSLLDIIIENKNQKNREALLPFKGKIKERYNYYMKHYNELESIRSLGTEWQPIKDELISCYGNNVAFLEAKKKLITAMPTIIQNNCPYCMLNRPNTLDHYFDKSDYPEYAVFIPNLVLCCSECNTLKGTTIFDSTGQRKFIHFYHDRIPDYQFLFIRFKNTNEDVIPEIKVYLQFRENGKQKDIITAHFHNLKLHKKYKDSINDKLSVIMIEIRSTVGSGYSYNDIQTILIHRYQSMVAHYGFNYWESCIYEGILNSPDFLDNVVLGI